MPVLLALKNAMNFTELDTCSSIILFFCWLLDDGDGFGHGEDLDLRKEFGGEVGKSLRVEAARAGFG